MSKNYDKFNYHGGPYDRGMADSYYRRPRSPHKYPNGTYNGERVHILTVEETEAYNAGFDENEDAGDFKDWGVDEEAV